jgi:hypothetical protein
MQQNVLLQINYDIFDEVVPVPAIAHRWPVIFDLLRFKCK